MAVLLEHGTPGQNKNMQRFLPRKKTVGRRKGKGSRNAGLLVQKGKKGKRAEKQLHFK